MRSKITEIVIVSDILFALARSGVCVAFSRGINKKQKDDYFLNYVVNDERTYLT